MNDNPTPPPSMDAGSPLTPSVRENYVIAIAHGTPDMLQKAETMAPDLAAKWTGKAIVWSKSPWGTLLSGVIGMFATKYGLACIPDVAISKACWTPEFIATVSGFAGLGGAWVGAYIMRCVTSLPITGVVKPATVADVVQGMK